MSGDGCFQELLSESMHGDGSRDICRRTHEIEWQDSAKKSFGEMDAGDKLTNDKPHVTEKGVSKPLHSSSIVLQMDDQGHILSINKFGLDFFGYVEEELLGKNVIGTIVPEVESSGRDLRKMIKDIGQNPKNYTFNDNENVRKNGERVWVVWTNRQITRGDGATGLILCSGTDITSLKLAKDRSYHLIKDLSIKNQALSRENEELKCFCYTISHDLRSPLINIIGLIDLLESDLKEKDLEQIDEDMEMIKTTASAMDSLIKDTLELSRIGLAASPSEHVAFVEIVEEALEYMNLDIKSKGVEVSYARDFPEVLADRKKLVEALINLVDNSLKYGCSGAAPKVEIGFRGDGQETVFYVRDNGAGIDPRHHHKIFDLFYKVNSNSRGTGAGLAIVKRIIGAHGGRIWVESELGRGCTMCFTLSLVDRRLRAPWSCSSS